MAFSQNLTEEDVVKRVVHFETISYLKNDTIFWKDQFNQNEKATRIFSIFAFSSRQEGLQNLEPLMLKWVNDNLNPSRYSEIQQTNHIIINSDDMASMTFHQQSSIPEVNSITPTISREYFYKVLQDINFFFKCIFPL